MEVLAARQRIMDQMLDSLPKALRRQMGGGHNTGANNSLSNEPALLRCARAHAVLLPPATPRGATVAGASALTQEAVARGVALCLRWAQSVC